MEQVIFGGSYDPPLDNNIEYNSLCGEQPWTTTRAHTRKVVSTSGKIKNLRVKLTVAPGSGKNRIFTLYVGGTPSALTITIADTATSGNDMVHEVDVVAGNYISLQCDPNGTPADSRAYWTSMFEGATAKESLILGGTGSRILANFADRYTQIMGGETDPASSENTRRQVCPTSGKIKNFYVLLDQSPGSGPDAYRFTLRKNGVSQSLTVTITQPDTTGNDTANEVTVAAGDVLTMLIEPLASPDAEPRAAWGMTFLADTDGESVIIAGSDIYLSTTATYYIELQGCDYSNWGTEATAFQLGQSCTLKKLYVLLSAAPGDGKSYTFTLRKPGNGQAAGNLTVTITGAATTTGNDTEHTDAIANDDYVDLECAPAETPSSPQAYWGLVGYIEPPAPPPGLENKSANMAAKMMAAGVL